MRSAAIIEVTALCRLETIGAIASMPVLEQLALAELCDGSEDDSFCDGQAEVRIACKIHVVKTHVSLNKLQDAMYIRICLAGCWRSDMTVGNACRPSQV